MQTWVKDKLLWLFLWLFYRFKYETTSSELLKQSLVIIYLTEYLINIREGIYL